MELKHQEKTSFKTFGFSNFSNFRTESESFSIVYNFAKKISQETKAKLVDLVTIKRYTIKEAAKILKISYSSAKKFFALFKKDLKDSKLEKKGEINAQKQSGFITIDEDQYRMIYRIDLTCSIAGRQIEKCDTS